MTGMAVVETESRLGANYNVVIGSNTERLDHMICQQRIPSEGMETAGSQVKTTHSARRRNPQTLVTVHNHRDDPVVAQMAQGTFVGGAILA